MPTTIINEYTIACDALKLMLLAPSEGNKIAKTHPLNVSLHTCAESYTAEEFTLKMEISSNHKFHIQFAVLVGDQCLGHIYSNPTKNYGYGKNLRPLHICNEALYTMPYASLIPKLLQAFNMVVHNTSQLDITIYTQQVDPAAFIKGFTQNPTEYERVKRKGDDGFHIMGKEDEKNGQQQCTTYIGLNNRRVQTTIYDKTKELADKGHKPYLREWLTSQGFDATRPAYSFEQSIKAEAFNHYKAFELTESGELLSPYHASKMAEPTIGITEKTQTVIDLSRLQNPAYLASVFEEFFNLDIRKKDKTRIANCTNVQLIDFGIFGSDQVNIMVSLSPQANNQTRHKRFIRECLQEFKQTGLAMYLEVASDVAQRFSLSEALNESMKKLKISLPTEAHEADYQYETHRTIKQLDIAA